MNSHLLSHRSLPAYRRTRLVLAATVALAVVASAASPATAAPPVAPSGAATVTTPAKPDPATFPAYTQRADGVQEIGAIESTGPLDRITTGPQLDCSVHQVGEATGEWFGDTACGTFLATAAGTYGATVPAGFEALPYQEVSQTATTGAGSAADPYRMTTTVTVPGGGLRLTQTDSYVTGAREYRTEVAIANTSTSARSFTLYRAGDCYFSGSDSGFGRVDAGAPACVAEDYETREPTTRVERLTPLTAGSHYLVDEFGAVWNRVAAGLALPDTVRTGDEDGSYTSYDNGVGLSWSLSLPSGGQTTIALSTYFSPPPLHTTVSADDSAVVPGARDGYTVEITNDTITTVDLASISVELAPGVDYVPGSTSGATTSDPAVLGDELVWTGPFSAPAGGSTELHLAIDVPEEENTYTVSVRAEVADDDGDQIVQPQLDAAPIAVAPVRVTLVEPSSVSRGVAAQPIDLSGSTFDEAGALTVSGSGVTVSDLTVWSSTSASAAVTVSATAPLGARDVTFTDSEGNSGTCTGCLVVINAPTITSITPGTLGQGAVGATLTIDGTNLTRTARLTIDGGVRVTGGTFISSSRVTVTVNVPATAYVGQHTVTLSNRDGGVATSTLTISPHPTVAGASPSVARGTTAYVTVTGSGFKPGLVVSAAAGIQIGAISQVTGRSFVMAVTVAGSVAPKTYPITVVNPDLGRGSAKVLRVT